MNVREQEVNFTNSNEANMKRMFVNMSVREHEVNITKSSEANMKRMFTNIHEFTNNRTVKFGLKKTANPGSNPVDDTFFLLIRKKVSKKVDHAGIEPVFH